MAACKGCGKEIVWGITADGKKIPLDSRAPVYSFTPLTGETLNGLKVERIPSAHVSHFSTCVKANDFSRGRYQKKTETAPDTHG